MTLTQNPRRINLLFNNSKAVFVKLSMVVLALTIVGCEPAAKPKPADVNSASENEHAHAHAATLAEAVKELEGICADVKTAFEKNDADAADEPLHEVGHVLEEIPKLAATSKLDDAGKAEVETAVKSMLDAFGAIHDGMHGGTGKKYTEVADAIEAALKTLIEKSKS